MRVSLCDHDTYSTYAYAFTPCTYGKEVYTHTRTHSCKTISIFEHALLWIRNEWMSWVFGLIEHNSMNYLFDLLTENKSKSNSYSHSHICTQLVFICAILMRLEEEYEEDPLRMNLWPTYTRYTLSMNLCLCISVRKHLWIYRTTTRVDSFQFKYKFLFIILISMGEWGW